MPQYVSDINTLHIMEIAVFIFYSSYMIFFYFSDAAAGTRPNKTARGQSDGARRHRPAEETEGGFTRCSNNRL